MPFLDTIRLNDNASPETIELFEALKSHIIQRFIPAFHAANCNEVDSVSRTVFSYAAEMGFTSFVDYMSNPIGNYDSIDAQGKTIDKSIADNKGKTALYYARKQRSGFGRYHMRNPWHEIVNLCRYSDDDDSDDDDSDEDVPTGGDDNSVGEVGAQDRRYYDALAANDQSTSDSSESS